MKEPEEMLSRLQKSAQEQGISFVHGSGKRKTQLQRDIEALEALLEKSREYAAHMEILGKRNSYSKTDHSATFMRMKDDHMQNGQLKPGYNVQLGIEAEYIVGVDVSSDLNDTQALLPLVKRMEEKGGIKHQDVTTDSGYETEETYRGMAEREQTAYIKPQICGKTCRMTKKKTALPVRQGKNCDSAAIGNEKQKADLSRR